MRRFNKFFAKKDKAEDPSPVSEPTDLASLSATELMSLVGKYEDELRKAHAALQTATEEKDKATQDAAARTEESKLYKELAESMQEQYQRAAGELGDLKAVLESKKTEVDVLRSQLLAQEEGSSRLKRDLQASEQRGSALESQLLAQENARQTSESEEVAALRAELARQTALAREGAKHDQRVQELEIIKKNMESELLKFSMQVDTTSAQLKQTREKLTETEVLLQKKQLNLDSFRQEAMSFGFQKESMENEVKAMKEVVATRDGAVERKKGKLRACRTELLRVRSELEAGKAETKDLQDSLGRLQQEFSQRVAYDAEKAQLEQATAEQSLRNTQRALEEVTQSLQAAFSKCEEREEKCAALEGQVRELLQTKETLDARLDACSQEEFRLKAQLDSAQRKREQARAELIKLSQRLEQKPAPTKSAEGTDIFPLAAGEESRVLPHLKRDVNLIYKSLMRAMLTAKDVPFPSEDLTKEAAGLLMDSELFSDVERKVNDLVMNLHEVLEAPDTVECLTESSPQTWSDRITSAMANIKQTVKTVGPVKLFSCMPTSSEKQPPPMTMKPKTEQGRRIMSATGGDRRFDQQTPPGWKQDQSGYKRL